MACQCGTCGGTGKCATCVGSGRAERAEFENARRIRRHRFDRPDPQPCGVWRYQAVLAVKTSAKPMTEGDMVANGESEPTNPECADEKTWPCSAECWRPCAKCHKPVCERHDYLVPVWPPENGAFEPADMICKECITAMWATGDISQGSRVNYLH
jgi:hypothetical protein